MPMLRVKIRVMATIDQDWPVWIEIDLSQERKTAE
jgi:hypothetical protein